MSKQTSTQKLVGDIYEAITLYQAHSSAELNTIVKGLNEIAQELSTTSKQWAMEDLPDHIEIPWIVSNMMPYVVISTYVDQDDLDATTTYPYCLYADSEEEAYEKVKAMLVYDEIEEQHHVNGGDSEDNYVPLGHYENNLWDYNDVNSSKFNPITWDAIDGRNKSNKRGFAISKPILLDQLIKQTTLQLIK